LIVWAVLAVNQNPLLWEVARTFYSFLNTPPRISVLEPIQRSRESLISTFLEPCSDCKIT
jgi:hypothetical protein